MTALGFGAAFGVVDAAVVAEPAAAQDGVRFAVIGVGAFLVLAASFSTLAPAALMIGGVGACAGTSYVTGFTVLQENVERRDPRAHVRHALHRHPPVPADLAHHLAVVGRLLGLGHASHPRADQSSSIGPYTYALPGVRIALWGGGLITLAAGLRRGGRAQAIRGRQRRRRGARRDRAPRAGPRPRETSRVGVDPRTDDAPSRRRRTGAVTGPVRGARRR